MSDRDLKPDDRVTYYTGRGGCGTVLEVHPSEGFAVVRWDDDAGPRYPYLNALVRVNQEETSACPTCEGSGQAGTSSGGVTGCMTCDGTGKRHVARAE